MRYNENIMDQDQISILELHQRHIEGTDEKAVVEDITIVLCNLTFAVSRGCSFKTFKVYLTSRCLKHLYDKRNAEEFDCILKNLSEIVRYPDHIYENRSSKRGDLCFYKTIDEKNYLCTLEKDVKSEANTEIDCANYIATCFRLRDEDYIKKYKLLWSWKGGIPSS